MITVFVSFQLPEGANREQVMAGIKDSIPHYQDQDALVRKYICIDPERGRGRSVYLWRDRVAAEAFFAKAREVLRQQLGSEPEIEFWNTPVIVDNDKGSVDIDPAFAGDA